MSSAIEYVVEALSVGGLYVLFALGIALVFGVGGIVNFAHGQLIVLAMYAIVACQALPWPVAVAAALVTGTVGGVLMEAFVFRPARGAHPDTLLILSFALALAIESLVLLLVGALGKSTGFGSSLATEVHIGTVAIPKSTILTIIVAAGLCAGLLFLLRRTMLGIRLRAAAEDFEMARMLGVPANGVMRATFALGGLLAGVAGILLVIDQGVVTPDSGFAPVLVAFIATVIGGMDSIGGAAAGGMLLGVLTVVLQILLPTSVAPYRDAFLYTLVICLLVLRPGGLSAAARKAQRV